MGSSGPGSKTGRVTVLCSWTKHFTFSDSLHPGVQMGMGRLSGKPDEMLGVTL